MNESDKRLWWQAFLAGLANTEGNVSHRVEHSVRVAQESVGRYHAHCGQEPDDPPAAPYEGWAHLEVMGHRSHYGLVREVRGFGTRLIEIRELNGDGELVDAVIQYGGSAIFANTQLDEEVARHFARGQHRVTCAHRDEHGKATCDVEVWTTGYHDFCAEHRPTADAAPKSTGDDVGFGVGDEDLDDEEEGDADAL